MNSYLMIYNKGYANQALLRATPYVNDCLLSYLSTVRELSTILPGGGQVEIGGHEHFWRTNWEGEAQHF